MKVSMRILRIEKDYETIALMIDHRDPVLCINCVHCNKSERVEDDEYYMETPAKCTKFKDQKAVDIITGKEYPMGWEDAIDMRKPGGLCGMEGRFFANKDKYPKG